MTSLALDVYLARDSDEPPAPVLARDELTYESWGRGLTPAQYLDRERFLWRTTFAREGLCVFILRQGDAALASCEGYRVPVVTPGREGHGYGIASVFVEERLRGRGHASALLRAVHEQLQRAGALCTYLMSEVDPGIYARLGYVPRPVIVRGFAPEPRPLAPPLVPPAPPLTLIGVDEAATVVPKLLEARYQTRGALTLRLDFAQIDWHVQRGLYYTRVLGLPVPRTVGAVCGSAFALWSAGPLQNTLRVLCQYPGAVLASATPAPGAHPSELTNAHPQEAAAYRAVLHAARCEAHALGLGRVELWENPWNATFLRGGAPRPYEDMPMLAPLVPDLRAEDWRDCERGHWL